jgi:hypothetical protein
LPSFIDDVHGDHLRRLHDGREQSLHAEAFQEYWRHLSPDGMLMASQVMTSDYPGLMLG